MLRIEKDKPSGVGAWAGGSICRNIQNLPEKHPDTLPPRPQTKEPAQLEAPASKKWVPECRACECSACLWPSLTELDLCSFHFSQGPDVSLLVHMDGICMGQLVSPLMLAGMQ